MLLILCLLLSIVLLYIIQSEIDGEVIYSGEYKVRITEICSSNNSIDYDKNGNFSDYIEFYNYGETFNLKNFALTISTKRKGQYTFGDMEFESGTYMVLWLNGDEVPFKLAASGGETVSLVTPDAKTVCSATTESLEPDQVMLWSENGYTLSFDASPGFANTAEGLELFRKGTPMTEDKIVINELFIANKSAMPDFNGDFCDIIELKNVSNEAISLGDWYVSDSFDRKSRVKLPDVVLQPGEIKLIYASGKDTLTDGGEFHTDFRISLGETVYLFYQNTYAELVTAECDANFSQSRLADGNYTTMTATPGFENTDEGYDAFCTSRLDGEPSIVISELLLKTDLTAYGGALRDVAELHNTTGTAISLLGWYISDDPDEPYKYALPDVTVDAGGYYLIYCENSAKEGTTGFALSSDEYIYLTTPEHKQTAAVSCVSAGRGMSRSLGDDGGYYDGEISLGYSNDENGIELYAKSVRPDTVEISEAVSLNSKYLAGPYGTYNDFCELHNLTDHDITLDGWYLSDNPKKPKKASLDGITIKAGEYLCIILSKDGLNIRSGYDWVALSLSFEGETLCLSNGDVIIDCMAMPMLAENTSYGRPDGKDAFAVLTEPTPDKSNSAASLKTTPTPTASIEQGVYDGSQTLYLELFGEGKIYYTLDCTEPTASSTPYTSPIEISKTTIVRCIAISEGCKASAIKSLSYIVGEGDTLETVSLVCAPDDLFDYYTGIYATGPNASSTYPYKGANYWQRWERACTVSFFGDDLTFSENAGLRIFGGWSRAEDKKSLAVFFRAKYGASSLNVRLFEDSDLACYEAFILRNTGQDVGRCWMRDALITKVAGTCLGLDYQNNRPVVVYLNGEFWGLYYIREKANENFIGAHQNVDPDTVEITAGNGTSSADYKALMTYVKSHDLSVKEYYDYVCSQVDIDNYIDYIIAEMIIANTDNGNIKFYKTEGGKWRWIIYDVDQSSYSPDYNTVKTHLDPNGTGAADMYSTALINGLLKNKEFFDKFLTRFAYQLNEVWTPERMNAEIDRYYSLIKDALPKESAKWGRSIKYIDTNINRLRRFFNERNENIVPMIQAQFGLSDSEMLVYGFRLGE